jgi:prolyl-tRNA editing enzyme YbaK/EbsC (Cys-tRNA(Pro) deacylase)
VGPVIGTLDWVPVLERLDLLAPSVAEALGTWPHTADVQVAQIDPALADTAALAEAHGVPLDVSANCVVVAGKREGEQRVAACLVLASTRADVNGLVRRTLEVRKASFLPMDDAVERTSMEYGGITPVGLPSEWTLLVDAAVVARPFVVVGSGVRRSKLALPGRLAAELPGARVLEGLGMQVGTPR